MMRSRPYLVGPRVVTALVALGAILLLTTTAAVGPQPGPAQAADGAAFTITATPTTNLVDGQQIAIEVTARDDVTLTRVTARVCRSGVPYATYEDTAPQNGNCSTFPVSSSADPSAPLPVYPGGKRAAGRLAVGVGTVAWTVRDTPFSLTCDPSNPCQLVVSVRLAGSTTDTYDGGITLTYRDSDPTAGCGGLAEGAVAMEASDRLSQAWIDWTIAGCTRPEAEAGAPTRASFTGEGPGLDSFAAGTADVALSAIGHRPGVAGFDPPEPRAASPVPVAVNAVVIGVAGGELQGQVKVPYHDVKLTLDEVTELVTGGVGWLQSCCEADVLARNPEFARSLRTGSEQTTVAVAGADATSLFTTRYLDEMRPELWTSPITDAPRGVDAWLAVADPAFPGLELLSGRPPLQKVVTEANRNPTPGPRWFLTDLATATQLGITPVAIQGPDGGEFVVPTPESLAAAVPLMTTEENGTRSPDPQASAPAEGPTPYPLTFVEYALAPAEPLLDADCSPRGASQALLGDWLTYVTSDEGQAALADGFVPLTAELRAEAAASIAAVGASTPTGPCAPEDPPVPPPVDGPNPVDAPGPGGGGFGPGGFGGSDGPGGLDGSLSGGGPAGIGAGGNLFPDAAGEVASAQGELIATTGPSLDAPGFAQNPAVSWLLTGLGLVMIGGLTAAVALSASGRRLRLGSGRSAPGGVGDGSPGGARR